MLQSVEAIYEDGVLKPLEPLQLAEHQRVRVSVSDDQRQDNGAEVVNGDESFFDAASRMGFIGCIKGTPSDLSTNKKYMDGFGERDA